MKCRHVVSGLRCLLLPALVAGCPGGGVGVATGDAPAGTPAVAAATGGMARARAAADTLINGGDADFDGDGVVDARTTVAGDGRTTVYFGAPGKARLTIVTRGSSVEARGDFNEDGTADFHHTGSTVGDTRTQNSTWDSDFDGVVDETETLTFIGALGLRRPVRLVARHERRVYDPITGTDTIKVSERDDLAVDASGDQDYLVNFPTAGTLVPIDDSHPNIRVYEKSDAAPGGCDEDQREQLRAAMENFEQHQIDCLMESNKVAGAAVRQATHTRNIEVACAPSKDSWSAADVGPMLGDEQTRTSYRLNLADKTWSKGAVEEGLLHELMHVSGFRHVDKAEENARTDRINSCAIYCSGCKSNGKPSERASHDCARCTEPGKKAACGKTMRTKGMGPCHREHMAACLGDHAVVDCADCVHRIERHCDESIIVEDAMPMCCAECPAGTTMNLECSEGYPSFPKFHVDTCKDPPPACR